MVAVVAMAKWYNGKKAKRQKGNDSGSVLDWTDTILCRTVSFGRFSACNATALGQLYIGKNNN
jgi:hypothetical protein